MRQFKINEIFYSLQGEGYFTGVPSIFIRFSGCNLRCPFCDTAHQQGILMDVENIVSEACKYPASHIVLTGGEPSLFINDEFVSALKSKGKFIAIETNGTHTIPSNIDWITLSPKFEFCNTEDAFPKIYECNELKVVFSGQDLSIYDRFHADHYFLQPCDMADREQNRRIITSTINACLTNPKWRLSLQVHKLLGIR